MSTAPPTETTARKLLHFRIMAFATGVMLLTGCTLLIFKYPLHKPVEPLTGLVWMAHGWLYLIYVITVFLLGLHLRWSFVRMLLVMAAGMVPTASFIAEHFVTRDVRQAEVRAQ